jgi:hypothetical protein
LNKKYKQVWTVLVEFKQCLEMTLLKKDNPKQKKRGAPNVRKILNLLLFLWEFGPG